MSQQNRRDAVRLIPMLQQLEGREVPAIFYVDSSLAGSTAGQTVTFNAVNPANSKAGLTFGTNAFADLKDAIDRAELDAVADEIKIATGNTTLNNSAGRQLINNPLTISGDGKNTSVIKPTTNAVSDDPNIPAGDAGIFEIISTTFTGTNFGFDALGKDVGLAFYVEDSKASFTGVSINNVIFTTLGTGIFANNSSTVTVNDGGFGRYGATGIVAFDSTVNASNSAFFGLGATTDHKNVNYGISYQGGSGGTLFKNTFAFNQGVGGGGELSAGVQLFQDVKSPFVTITENGFVSNTFGAVVGADRGNDNANAIFRKNQFAKSNDFGLVARNNQTIDAQFNYWGAASGPNDKNTNDPNPTNPNGTGTVVDSQVNYLFFYRVPPALYNQVDLGVAPVSGGSNVNLIGYNSTTKTFDTRLSVAPFGGTFKGEVNVATGDFDGNGVTDFVVSQGPGAGSSDRIQLYNGVNGALVADFNAFGSPTFSGGLSIAFGDVTGDGKDDLLISPQTNGGPTVRMYDFGTGANPKDLTAFEGNVYLGGLSNAAGDVNNDGFEDIIVGGGVFSGSRVQILDGKSFAQTGTKTVIDDFTSFELGFTGEVYVSADDFDGDGHADVAVSQGVGGNSRYRVFKSITSTGKKGQTLLDTNVLGIGPVFLGGTQVTSGDFDGSVKNDLVFGLFSALGSTADSNILSNAVFGFGTQPSKIAGPIYPGSNGVNVG